MLNEEKIKEQFQLAKLDREDERTLDIQRSYFRGDYIAKELLKSFFAGTIVFVMLAILKILKNISELELTANQVDYKMLMQRSVALYLVFMAIYFVITFMVYFIRFQNQRKKIKAYRIHLKRLEKIYQMENK